MVSPVVGVTPVVVEKVPVDEVVGPVDVLRELVPVACVVVTVKHAAAGKRHHGTDDKKKGHCEQLSHASFPPS